MKLASQEKVSIKPPLAHLQHSIIKLEDTTFLETLVNVSTILKLMGFYLLTLL
jgi:hypothetical protein